MFHALGRPHQTSGSGRGIHPKIDHPAIMLWVSPLAGRPIEVVVAVAFSVRADVGCFHNLCVFPALRLHEFVELLM